MCLWKNKYTAKYIFAILLCVCFLFGQKNKIISHAETVGYISLPLEYAGAEFELKKGSTSLGVKTVNGNGQIPVDEYNTYKVKMVTPPPGYKLDPNTYKFLVQEYPHDVPREGLYNLTVRKSDGTAIPDDAYDTIRFINGAYVLDNDINVIESPDKQSKTFENVLHGELKVEDKVYSIYGCDIVYGDMVYTVEINNPIELNGYEFIINVNYKGETEFNYDSYIFSEEYLALVGRTRKKISYWTSLDYTALDLPDSITRNDDPDPYDDDTFGYDIPSRTTYGPVELTTLGVPTCGVRSSMYPTIPIEELGQRYHIYRKYSISDIYNGDTRHEPTYMDAARNAAQNIRDNFSFDTYDKNLFDEQTMPLRQLNEAYPNGIYYYDVEDILNNFDANINEKNRLEGVIAGYTVTKQNAISNEDNLSKQINALNKEIETIDAEIMRLTNLLNAEDGGLDDDERLNLETELSENELVKEQKTEECNTLTESRNNYTAIKNTYAAHEDLVKKIPDDLQRIVTLYDKAVNNIKNENGVHVGYFDLGNMGDPDKYIMTYGWEKQVTAVDSPELAEKFPDAKILYDSHGTIVGLRLDKSIITDCDFQNGIRFLIKNSDQQPGGAIPMPYAINYEICPFVSQGLRVGYLDSGKPTFVQNGGDDEGFFETFFAYPDGKEFSNINAIIDSRKIIVRKHWDLTDIPDDLTIGVCLVKKDTREKIGDDITLNNENNWTYEWTLPDGEVYSDYVVKEVEGTGYKQISYVEDNNIIHITNEKLWDVAFKKIDMGSGNPLPDAEFTLSGELDDSISIQSVSDENGNVIFSGIKKGNYKISETVTPDGYIANNEEINVTVTDTGVIFNENETALKVKNNKIISVVGTKTWDDDNYPDRPEKITVYLKANNEAAVDINGDIVDGKVVTADDGWQYVFSHLPECDENGVITYTVEEESIPEFVNGDKYVATYSNDGYDITNTIVLEPLYKMTYKSGMENNPDAVFGNIRANTPLKIKTPEALSFSKPGHHFIKWEASDSLLLEYQSDDDYIMPASDVVFTAVWEKNKYTLTYELDEADDSVITVPGILHGDTVTVLGEDSINYKKTKNKFVRWKNKDTGEYVDPDDVLTINEDVTLVAEWKPVYDISYFPGDGTGETYIQSGHTGGQEVVVVGNDTTSFLYEGHKFSHWETDNENINPGENLTVTGDIKLTAAWERNRYTLTYELDETGDDTITVPDILHGDTVTVLGEEDINYTKPKHRLIMWKKKSTGEYVGHKEILIITEDTVLIPVWKPVYSVVYKSGYDDTNTYFEGDYDSGSEVTVIGNEITGYELGGHTFSHWINKDNGTVKPGEKVVVNEDVVLTAKWEKNKYALTYELGGDEGDKLSIQDLFYGDSVVVFGEKDFNYLYPGHRLTKWQVKDTDKYINPDDTLTITEDISLVAVWEPVHSITYSSGGNEDENYVVGDHVYGSDATVVGNDITNFSRRGYKFLHWLAEDGSIIMPGGKITINGDTLLMAKWEELPYKIIYKSETPNLKDYVEDVKAGDIVTILNYGDVGFARKESEYIFTGWKSDDIGVTNIGKQFIMPDKDITLTATWKKREQPKAPQNLTENKTTGSQVQKWEQDNSAPTPSISPIVEKTPEPIRQAESVITLPGNKLPQTGNKGFSPVGLIIRLWHRLFG